MESYRRIMALVELDAQDELVVRRAAQMALAHNAALAVASIVDYTPDFEADHVPFRSVQEWREVIARNVAGKLHDLVSRIGQGGAEVIVVSGEADKATADLAHSWRPDLVLVGSHSPQEPDHPSRALLQRDGRLPFDLLVVQMGKPSLAGKVIQALSAAI